MLKTSLMAILTVSGLALATNAHATTIGFEGVAPPGSLVNVNPLAPYTEAGFTFTPTNANSAVFDAAAGPVFPGDPTDWFGFAEDNIITMSSPTPFSLSSMLMGGTTIGGGTTDITVLGHLAAGGTVSATFLGLSNATLETFNWTGLSSVDFRVTDDSALDDIVVNAVPEPASLLLLGSGLALAARFRKRKQQNG